MHVETGKTEQGKIENFQDKTLLLETNNTTSNKQKKGKMNFSVLAIKKASLTWNNLGKNTLIGRSANPGTSKSSSSGVSSQICGMKLHQFSYKEIHYILS